MLGILFFGTPGGFEVVPVLGEKSISKNLDFDRIMDLPNTQINIFPETEIYRLLRLSTSEGPIFIFCKYIHALEIKNTRGGTFVGCALVCEGSPVAADVVIKALDDFTDALRIKLLSPESRFKMHITDLDTAEILHTPEYLKEAGRLQSFVKEFKKEEAFIPLTSKPKDLENRINELLISDYYSKYSDVYFSKDDVILDFTLQKGELEIISEKKLVEAHWNSQNQKLQREIELLKKTSEQQVTEISRLKRIIKQKGWGGDNTQDRLDGFKSKQESETLTRIEDLNSPRINDQPSNALKELKRESRVLKYIIVFLFLVILSQNLYLVFSSDQLFPSPSEISSQTKSKEISDEEIQSDGQKDPIISEDHAGGKTRIEKIDSTCDWKSSDSIWVYVGSSIKDVTKLTKDIVELTDLKSCKGSYKEVEAILIKNASDIVNGKIKYSGNIQFRLPKGFQIVGNPDYIKRRKLRTN